MKFLEFSANSVVTAIVRTKIYSARSFKCDSVRLSPILISLFK
jgi:hypothetical protein